MIPQNWSLAGNSLALFQNLEYAMATLDEFRAVGREENKLCRRSLRCLFL